MKAFLDYCIELYNNPIEIHYVKENDCITMYSEINLEIKTTAIFYFKNGGWSQIPVFSSSLPKRNYRYGLFYYVFNWKNFPYRFI